MKRIILALIMAFSFSFANAITLFPHFVDVAGDYENGTPEKFAELNIPTIYWRVAPSFYSNIQDADSFLKDTLPFSSYSIERIANKLDNGTEIIVYSSSLEADGLNEGKWSKLYLLQSPDEPLYVAIYEDQL